MQGIVFPGSKYSVYDSSLLWINPLKEFVRDVYFNFPEIKMVGACFGHQLIALSLGGKVEKMENGGGSCLYTGKEHIRLSDSFLSLPYVKEVVNEYDWE